MAIDPKTGKDSKKIMIKKSSMGDNYNIELTKRYSDNQEKMADNVSKKQGSIVEDKIQGINIDKSELKSAPKKFLRKVVKTGGENGMTKIISEDGKTVKYEGRNYLKSTSDALKKNEKETNDTNKRRENNSNFYNVSSGAKKDLEKEDKDRLVKLGSAVKK